MDEVKHTDYAERRWSCRGVGIDIPVSDGFLHVLFANHNGRGPEGGGGQVLAETAAGLRKLGVSTKVTTDLYPDVRGFDVVHAFNVWPPETSLPQMRYLRDTGVPIVWEPIFSDLYEFTWAKRVMRLLSESVPGSEGWARVLDGLGSETLVIDGLSRWSPNEICPGYLAAAAEMFAMAGHVSVCSLHEIGMLSRMAPGVAAPFSVVHHGVDAPAFADATARDFTDRYGLVDFILCVGSVEPRKNQLMLIEAARDLDRSVVLVGSTHPVDQDYLELCRVRGGDAVVYVGQIPRELVASAYKAAAVHVLPSFAEGSALSTMEAAAAGCDIVTSNRGSEFEYYGDLVRTCDPLSPSSICAAIKLALTDSRGEELAMHMHRFPWSRTAEMTLRIYHRAI